jgi:hypothetical protein
LHLDMLSLPLRFWHVTRFAYASTVPHVGTRRHTQYDKGLNSRFLEKARQMAWTRGRDHNKLYGTFLFRYTIDNPIQQRQQSVAWELDSDMPATFGPIVYFLFPPISIVSWHNISVLIWMMDEEIRAEATKELRSKKRHTNSHTKSSRSFTKEMLWIIYPINSNPGSQT